MRNSLTQARRFFLAMLALSQCQTALAMPSNNAQAVKASPGIGGKASIAAVNPELRGPITTPLTIQQAMDETLLQSPRASSLRLQIGITKSRIARATELPNPSLFMDNGYKAEFTYRYGVSVPIEPPWKLALRLLAAKKQIKVTDLEIAKGLWALRGDIRRAYTNALISIERYETLRELSELYKGLADSARKRFDAGDVAQLDVYRADLAYQKAIINRDAAFNQVGRAKQSLSVLLGRTYNSEFAIPRLPSFASKSAKLDYLPDMDTTLPDLDKLLNQAYDSRLEVKIVDGLIQSNAANLKVAYGNILPNPTIGAGSSVVNGPPLSADATPFTKNNFKGFFLQANVPLPIFNFQQGDIKQFRATIDQLKAEKTSQKNIVQQEVVDTYRALALQRQKIQSYQETALGRSQQIAQMAKRSYEIGQSDITSVLLAQQENVDVRNEYLDAVNAYEIAYTNLEQSIGATFY